MAIPQGRCPQDQPPKKAVETVSARGRTVCLTLPILTSFSGEESIDDEDEFK